MPLLKNLLLTFVQHLQTFERVPAAYSFFAGTVPAAYSLFVGSVPAFNLFHNERQQKGQCLETVNVIMFRLLK